MKSDLKSSPKLPKIPLPIYKAVKIGDMASKDGDKFSILAGLNKKLISELKDLSLNMRDQELQENTGDKKRFGEGSYKDWYSKNRVPFALVHDKTGALAALAWLGPKSLGKKSIKYVAKEKAVKKSDTEWKNIWHTIAFRAYPPFRGKGLTKKFVALVIDAYMKKFPNIKIWNGIYAKNIASRKLSEGLGFQTLEKLSDRKANWLVMVKY